MEAVGFERTMEIEAALFLMNALIYTVFTESDLRKEKASLQSDERRQIGPNIESEECNLLLSDY